MFANLPAKRFCVGYYLLRCGPLTVLKCLLNCWSNQKLVSMKWKFGKKKPQKLRKSQVHGPMPRRSHRLKLKLSRVWQAVRARPALVAIGPARALRRLFSLRTLGFILVKTIKYAVILLLSVGILASLTLFVVSRCFDGKDVNGALEKIVRENTGADLSIEHTDLSFFTGITFSGLTLYPDDKARAAQKKPLLNIRTVNLHWDFLRALIFNFRLKSAEFVDPAINLEQSADGRWNFTPILDYLAQHGETNAPEPEANAPAPDADDAMKISTLLPVHPSAILIMPFKLALENIGFSNLSINLSQDHLGPDKKVTKSFVQTSGLSTKASLFWFGTESHFNFKIYSLEDKPFRLIVQQNSTDPEPLDATVFLDNEVSLDNFESFKLKIKADLKTVKGKNLKLSNLPILADIEVGLLNSLDGVNLKKATLDILHIVKSETSGKLSLADQRLDQFEIDLAQNSTIDLDAANKIVAQLGIPLNLAGQINLQNLSIAGPLKPKKIDENLAYGTIPRLSMNLSFDRLASDIKDQNISLHPTSGNVKLSVNTTPGENGVQVDLGSTVQSDGASVRHMVDGNAAKVDIFKLNHSLSARVSYPDMVVPFVRLGLDIAKITAQVADKPPISMPFTWELFASASKNQQNISLDSKLELEDLLDFNIDLRCSVRCNRIKLNQSLQLEDFAKLFAFAQPVLSKVAPLDFIPKSLTGKLSLQTQIKGQSKNIQETKIEKIINDTTGKVDISLSLEKFGIVLPFKNIRLSNFATRLNLGGSFTEQFLEMKNDFDELALNLDDKKDKPKVAQIKHLSFSNKISNTLDLTKGLDKIKDHIETSLQSNLYIGQVSMKGILPQPINSAGLALDVKQSNVRQIELRKIELKAPDFGAQLAVSGYTQLSKVFFPESLKVQTTATIEHSGSQGVHGGIKTSGSMVLESKVQTDNMKTFSIQGKSSFEQFNVTVNDPKGGKAPLLVVEQVNGDFPLSQDIDISPYIDLTKFAKGPDAKVAGAGLPEKPASSDKTLAAKGQVGSPKVDDAKTPSDGKSGASAPAGKSEIANGKGAGAAVAAKDTPKKDEISDPGKATKAPKSEVPEISVIDKYYQNTQSSVSQNTNLVGHADFLTVKGFYPDKRTLSIKRVSVANLDLNDLEFDIDVKQNWFSLSQFTIGFLQGKIQGDIKLAFSPMPDKFQMSVHLTKLNTTKLLENFPNLKNKTQSWDLFSDPYLDMNVHIDFDIRNNDLAGGIDITRIGKEQLKMMLFYLDPEEKNPSLAYIRTALAFGDISGVTIPIKSGFIGLDVGVTVLAVPIPLPKLDRFPVAQLIANFQVDAKPAAKEEDDAT